MGLDKTIISLLMNMVKNISKFESGINTIQSNFTNSCPPKSDLLKFIKTKNQISNALTQIQSQLQVFNKTKITVEKANETFTKIITAIKIIPFPTATAGVGIPISALTNLSEILDNVGDKLKQGKGILKAIPGISNDINKYISDITNKLNILDNSILKCLEGELIGLTESERIEYLNTIGLNLIINPQSNVNNINKIPDFNGFSFSIEYDSSNKFPFPRRRIRAQRGKMVLLGEFSYSSTTDILMDEMKFKINNL